MEGVLVGKQGGDRRQGPDDQDQEVVTWPKSLPALPAWAAPFLQHLTWLSRPRKMSIMKNKVAHSGERGIMVTALG